MQTQVPQALSPANISRWVRRRKRLAEAPAVLASSRCAGRYNREDMFSSRFHWDPRPNRLTLALAARRAAGAPILDLTESNPTHAGLHYSADIPGAFADPRMLAYEPAPAGTAAAREAVSAYYAARGHSVSPGRMLLTASTSEAYAYLFKLLADPGDEVLTPQPVLSAFRISRRYGIGARATVSAGVSRRVAHRYPGAWRRPSHRARAPSSWSIPTTRRGLM